MVLEVLSDGFIGLYNRDSVFFKVLFWSDAAEKQDLWCVDCTPAEDHFFACMYLEKLASALGLEFDANDGGGWVAESVHEQTSDLCTACNGQIGSFAHLGRQVCRGEGGPLALGINECLQSRGSQSTLRCVDIGRRRDACILACRQKPFISHF